MLRIRLKRTGRSNSPAYRLVLAEHSKAVKGKSKEDLGYFLPTRKEPVLEYNEERISYWIEKGAIPTDTVARLLTKAGVKGLEKYIDKYVHKKKRKAKEEEGDEGAPAAAPPVEKAEDDPAKETEETKESEDSKEKKLEDKPAEEVKPEPEEEKKEEAEATEEPAGDTEEKSE